METAINVVKDCYSAAIVLIEEHPHAAFWLIVAAAVMGAWLG